MSCPVFTCPSACSLIFPRKLLSTRVCCVSARPSSVGNPAWRIELMGLAPVPPSHPLINTISALAFTTPAAIVPTPDSDTNFTLIRARGFTFFKSKIN